MPSLTNAVVMVLLPAALWAQDPGGSAPERRALAYLAGEVPRWSRENGCFSCHNNGDGARALYAAVRLGLPVDRRILEETTAWLEKPQEWSSHKSDVAFADSRVARIQFAASLAAANQAGLTGRPALLEAATSLLGDQLPDGSWRVGSDDAVGSPVTYGPFLATYTARTMLEQADAARFSTAIAKADGWLLRAGYSAVIDAAAIAMAFRDDNAPEASGRAQKAVDLILGAQASDGGWGPYRGSPSEVFDTAVALLALAPDRDRPEIRARLQRGRGYLVGAQLSSGGWSATTRPSGAQSYAQHVSTTAWALLALLATE